MIGVICEKVLDSLKGASVVIAETNIQRKFVLMGNEKYISSCVTSVTKN